MSTAEEPAPVRPGPDPAASSVPARAGVVVVGAGIVGLATARELLRRDPERSVVVLEREPEIASHQTGRNSGVVHAGVYYQPGSAKARLCVAGKTMLEAYCAEHGIPLQQVGKLVVALTPEELPRLAALEERARANGVPGLEMVGPEGIREREPHVAGIRALVSPTTGIVDYRAVARSFADEVVELGGRVITRQEVREISERGGEVVVRTPSASIVCSGVITCPGLWADTLRPAGSPPDGERIVPFRGDYYLLRDDARELVNGLVYPVPDPRFPFLGIHLTRRIDGEVWAGPNAVLALARTGYRRRDLNPADLARVLTYPGFLRLAARAWRVGVMEQWRDLSRRSFAASVRRFLPQLHDDQLLPGPSGIRAQALDRSGALVDDFRLAGSARVVRVLNAPSPAATASLAIAGVLADELEQRLAA